MIESFITTEPVVMNGCPVPICCICTYTCFNLFLKWKQLACVDLPANPVKEKKQAMDNNDFFTYNILQ